MSTSHPLTTSSALASTARVACLLALAASAISQEATREQRQAIARGKTLLVSVTATKKSTAEVLAELSTKTAVPIERAAVPADAVTTIPPAEVSLWNAVDQICRTHGKLAWDVSEQGVAIRSEPYVAPHLATTSGFGVLFRSFERKADRGEEYASSQAVVLGPPGAVVAVHYLTYTELVDDKGTNLLKTPAAGGFKLVSQSTFGSTKRLPDPDPSRPFCEAPKDMLKAVPAAAATNIKSCKGPAVIRAVVELKKTVDISGAKLKAGAKADAAASAIEIESLDVVGQSVKVKLALTDARRGAKDKASFYPETPGKLVLRDSAGAEVRGVAMNPTTGSATLGFGGSGNETMHCEVTGQLPDKTTLAAIELWEPGAVEETKIPFAFKDIPIKAAK
jgi:hypothetical protein